MNTPRRQFDLWTVLVAMVYPTLLTCAYFLWFKDAGGWQKGVYAVGKLAQFVFPIFCVAWLAQERLQFGFRRTMVGWGLAFGGVVGTLLVTGYFLGLKAWLPPQLAAEVQGKLVAFGITSVVAYAALGLFYTVVHSLLEEYYWRWFVFRRLESFVSPTVAIVVSGLGFMAHHVVVLGTFFGWDNPLGYLCSLAVAIGGWFWAWLYRRSDYQLLAPWLSHLLIDAAIFFVGYDLARVVFV